MLHGVLVAIDWAHLAHVNGEGVEKLAALLLRHQYPDAWQINPSQGDGGIDVYRRTPRGLQVWQIKRFSTPLIGGQRKQVKQSWSTFFNAHPAQGTPIHSYTLVTVWTPTEPAREWWNSKVVSGATFPVFWDGDLFFNSLDSQFPHVTERFLKPDFLESSLMAKSVLAASPIEGTDGLTILDAARRRDLALASVREMVSDHYRIDTAIITTGSKTKLPLDQLNPAGVQHRVTAMEGGRWHIESAVPRGRQSLEDDPITLDVQFRVESGSAEAEMLDQWDMWGAPLENVPAVVRHSGGPFSNPGGNEGLISFVHVRETVDVPGRMPDIVLCDPAGAHRVRFNIEERTQGRVGGGRRLVAVSRSGLLRLELRLGSTEAPDGWTLGLNDAAGLDPRRVRSELAALDRLSVPIPETVDPAHRASAGGTPGTSAQADAEFKFEVRLVLDDDDPELSVQELLATATQLSAPPIATWLLQIAEALTVLDPFSSETFAMPDIGKVTADQLNDLIWHAGIYAGESETITWEKVTFTVADGPSLATAWQANADGYLVETTCPQLALGEEVLTLDWPYARTVRMPPLPLGLAEAAPGAEIAFYPGADNSMTIGLVAE